MSGKINIMKAKEIKINIKEKFKHLSKAPIVEAIIEFQTDFYEEWKTDAIKEFLIKQLPKYPIIKTEKKVTHKFIVGSPDEHNSNQVDWGFRLKSQDNLYIARFNRDGFSCSHLEPYSNWGAFITEALRLWDIYYKLGKPSIINRLGIRVIDRISVPSEGLKLEDYIKQAPKPLNNLNLFLDGFLHQENFTLPNYPYGINVIRTIQPQADNKVDILLDIDVFTLKNFEINSEILNKYLTEMRWIKNKIFFNSITKKTLELFL